MGHRPCVCGCTPKTATLIIAYMDMIGSILLGIIILSGWRFSYECVMQMAARKGVQGGTGFFIGFVVVTVASLVGNFYMGLTLKRGADKEHLGTCRIWFFLSGINIILIVAGVFVNGATGVVPTLSFLVLICFKAYALWIVYEFMKQLICQGDKTYASGATRV